MTASAPPRPIRKANRRLLFVVVGGGVLMVAVILAAIGASQSAAFFQTPSEVLENPPEPGRSVRVGGLVVPGSVSGVDGQLRFILKDDQAQMPVVYGGPVPSLFREGQCVIAEGKLDGATIAAARLLAKHDEQYTPPELVESTRLAKSCGPEIDGAELEALG